MAQCVEGVSAQATEDCEHIVVDGGSDDGTVAVLQRIAPQHRNLRWVSEKDRGQSDAMNKGVILAKGDIIGMLSCDDFYEQKTLADIANLFRDLPEPALCVGNCKILEENDDVVSVNKPKRLNFYDLLSGDEKFAPFPVNPSAYFYHKSLHNLIGLYDVNEHYVMDLDFLLRAVKTAHVRYVDRVLGNFRLVPGTKTFEDIRGGTAEKRFETLLSRHRSQLSVVDRARFCSRKFPRKFRRLLRSL